ncbi:hypothetical protein CFP71_00815 [Amycolatopsis thailandensis]|uniref:DUF1015 domain-containing protein n=1 Tax=Amycolatopsis thailandensis TaxID=589330 RepID=A0A229SIX1_9PSEU|nr:DUF1015 family protein [Amycolatopsis thailandensis]OXM58823.1 hypothetical protein CFP71_00815 [Amycolatopsis thailandensis]
MDRMSTWIRPIDRGWVVRDTVPGPDVDEFADPDRVAAALAEARGDSLLAVQHPARTPAALAGGLSIEEALPQARATFERIREQHYRPVSAVVAPYRIDGPDGVALGVLCLVDPAAVRDDGVTRVRHTEDVYPDVVADRAAMLAGLGIATSAAMLVPATGGRELTAQIELICRGQVPALSTVDGAGRKHELWLAGPGEGQDELLATLDGLDLLVADGNHRVAAAAASGRGALLALVTGGPGLRIGPIHRVLTGTGLHAATLIRRWTEAGFDVHPGPPEPPVEPGEVTVLAGASAYRVVLGKAGGDHAVVEQGLLREALGVDPEGPGVRPLLPGAPVPEDAEAVLLLAPVPYAEVLAVHAAGARMPRKATYFTPKPRSGLLLAEL